MIWTLQNGRIFLEKGTKKSVLAQEEKIIMNSKSARTHGD